MTDQQKIMDILERREYFDLNFPPIERCDARQDISYRLSNSCPSCGYLTLDTRCSWDICTFCFWEDDGQDNFDADNVNSGPNSKYSLTDHRLEIYDWFDGLKKSEIETENALGHELSILDAYIANKESDRQLVLNQIATLSKLFDTFRKLGANIKPDWKFITEDKLDKLKPAYNSGLAPFFCAVTLICYI